MWAELELNKQLHDLCYERHKKTDGNTFFVKPLVLYEGYFFAKRQSGIGILLNRCILNYITNSTVCVIF